MLFTVPLASLPSWLNRLGDHAFDWATTNGVAVIATIALASFALHAGTVLIDQVQASLQGSLEQNSRRSQRALTLASMLRSSMRTVILFAAALSLLSAVGLNITPLLASAGVVGLALGFGAQSLVRDVIAGSFILFEDQYGVGDQVDIDGKVGLVERMNLRITQLRSGAGELITLPNGSIKIVCNQSKEWARAILEVPIDHDSDVDRALQIIEEEGLKLRAESPARVLEAPEVLGIQAFGESGLTLKVIMKTAPLQQGGVTADWRRRVKFAFDHEGIKLPRPQRVLRIVSSEKDADQLLN